MQRKACNVPPSRGQRRGNGLNGTPPQSRSATCDYDKTKQKNRPLDNGAVGYVVVWQNGQSWVGIKNHMGYKQEPCDTECATLARALEDATIRRTVPPRVTIFTDAQAAIRRMVS
jgi:hypothetical protein